MIQTSGADAKRLLLQQHVIVRVHCLLSLAPKRCFALKQRAKGVVTRPYLEDFERKLPKTRRGF